MRFRVLALSFALLALGAGVLYFILKPEISSSNIELLKPGCERSEDCSKTSVFDLDTPSAEDKAEWINREDPGLAALAPYIEAEDWDGARRLTSEMLEREPENLKLIQVRYALEASESDETGLEWLKSHARSNPSAELVLLDVQIEEGNWAQAEELSDSMAASPELLRRQSYLAYKQGKFEEAYSFVTELRDQRDSEWARDLLFEVLVGLQDFGSLVIEMQEIASSEPSNSRAQLRLEMANELLKSAEEKAEENRE